MALKNMTKLKLATFSIADIRAWGPCYDPERYLPRRWRGNALTLLRKEEIPAVDRLWVVLREEVLPAKELRLFAVWCAREALALVANPDPRSVHACDVAHAFAEGKATSQELEIAAYAARAAAYAAYAARAAARAAYAAYAADAAARADAADAADAAARADAAYAARAAARANQIDQLITMLTASIEGQ